MEQLLTLYLLINTATYVLTLHYTHPLQVILRCTVDHPYHCLYIILALSNASKDNLFPRTGYVTGSKGTSSRLALRSSSASSIDEVSDLYCH